MSRDYSSRRNAPAGKSRRKTPQRKAAARPASKKRPAGSGPPGWVWLVCGLCIGLTVAAGFYVFARPAGTPMREQIAITAPENVTDEQRASMADDNAETEAAPVQKEEEPRFSFYKMLPNYEVVIPEEEYPDKQQTSSNTHHSTPAGEPPPKPSRPQPTTPKVDEPGNYIIQAGSFSTFADADRRKAELALLGVPAQIVDVDLASGKTVYRVQSQTITSSSKLNDTLGRLRENRIDTLVMRAKN
ncbi:SPOR domain-containing protein [Salinisphaera sp. T31B1]|uniref:SPOR domain-containing protein n=1 Tax=Salinisphaera sp. T31B1 TaxID=727963 RepID=UPI003340F4E7